MPGGGVGVVGPAVVEGPGTVVVVGPAVVVVVGAGVVVVGAGVGAAVVVDSGSEMNLHCREFVSFHDFLLISMSNYGSNTVLWNPKIGYIVSKLWKTMAVYE